MMPSSRMQADEMIATLHYDVSIAIGRQQFSRQSGSPDCSEKRSTLCLSQYDTGQETQNAVAFFWQTWQ